MLERNIPRSIGFAGEDVGAILDLGPGLYGLGEKMIPLGFHMDSTPLRRFLDGNGSNTVMVMDFKKKFKGIDKKIAKM